MEQIIYIWIGMGYLALAALHSASNHPKEIIPEHVAGSGMEAPASRSAYLVKSGEKGPADTRAA